MLEIMVAAGFERPKIKGGTRTKCILHSGDSDSFSFSEQKGAWYCHRCNEGGGKIKLVQRALGLDSKSALVWIADLAGVSLTHWTDAARRRYAAIRRSAEGEAEQFLEWRASMLASLERARDAYFRAYHRCLRFILVHGLDHPSGDTIASACELYESRAIRIWTPA